MKPILTLLLFLLVNISIAQITTIDIVGGLHSTFRVLGDDGDNYKKEIVERRNNSEKRKLNFTLGININTKINDRVEFKSGLRYSELGYYSNYYGYPYLGFCGLDIAFLNGSYFFENKYIEIPLSIRLKGKERSGLIPFLEFGIAPSYLVRQSFGDEETLGILCRRGNNQEYEYSKLHIPATFALGAEYQFTNTNIGFFQIVNKTGLLTTGTEINERFYELGFEAGIRYSLSSIAKCTTNMKNLIKS